jgi:acetyl esterase/lipase
MFRQHDAAILPRVTDAKLKLFKRLLKRLHLVREPAAQPAAAAVAVAPPSVAASASAQVPPPHPTARRGMRKKALDDQRPARHPKAAMLLAAAMGGHAGAAGVVQETQVYKTTDRGPLHIEIFKPAGTLPAEGRACVVFFHGGAWRRGSPRQFRAFSTMLAERGVIGMTVEYRLLRAGEGDIPFDAVRDARSALRWVRKNASRLGCDLRRIGAGGGSAGGHLALMTAMKTTVDDPKDDLAVDPRPAALVLFNPPLNFDDYPSAVPLAERRKLAPYYLLDASLPPTLMMQGTNDRTVSYEQAVAFRDKARDVGVKDLTLVPFQGRPHGFFNKGKGEPGDFDASAGDMMDFLHRIGWL